MNERTTLATELNVFAEFKPRLPEPYQSSDAHFSGEYRSDAATFGAASGRSAAQGRRAGHHELLDRAHAEGTARDASSTPTS